MFTWTISLSQPGAPTELVVLNADPSAIGSEFSTEAEAGSRLPAFALGVMDVAGNRTAPSPNETWTVRQMEIRDGE